MFKQKRGFTLIELLVVIAIIGILSSVVLASLSSARTKSRDAKRVSDIKQMQLALELYYDDNGAYPSTLSAVDFVEGGYIAPVPDDPTDDREYTYLLLESGQNYVLRAEGEGWSSDRPPLLGDIDGFVGPNFEVDCADGAQYYCVQP